MERHRPSRRLVSAACAFGIAVQALPAFDNALSPGVAAEKGRWKLALEYRRYEGPVPPGLEYYTPDPSMGGDQRLYGTVVLSEAGGGSWELPLARGQDDGSAKVDICVGLELEDDWDGDRRPEVRVRSQEAPVRIAGAGIKPMGYFATTEYVLLPRGGGVLEMIAVGSSGYDEVTAEVRVDDFDVGGFPLGKRRRWTWTAGEAIPGPPDAMGSRLALEEMSPTGKRETWKASKTVFRDGSAEGSIRLATTDAKVRMRERPGLDGAILGELPRGALLEFAGMEEKCGRAGNLRAPWMKVRALDGPLAGREGYVFGAFCAPAP